MLKTPQGENEKKVSPTEDDFISWDCPVKSKVILVGLRPDFIECEK